MPVPPLNIFVGYAPKDEALQEELIVLLEPLHRQGVISDWHQQQILAGTAIERAIRERIQAAHVIVLLVSSDFLASDLCHGQEIKQLLETQSAGEACIVPVIVRDCHWEATQLAGLQALPRGARPVTSWRNRDQAWKDVVLGIRSAIEKLVKLPGKAEPRYESSSMRSLSLQLEAAYARRRELLEAGYTSGEVEHEILDLRRRLREGGRLRCGDSLGNGRYLLLETVGRGGFAFVWKAHDRNRGEIVAVKVLHTSLAGDPARVQRFFRGARKMAGIAHDAVVRVLNPRGEDGGYLYFVMEFIAGRNLRQAVLANSIKKEQVIPIVLRVGEALIVAHSQGLVHRDINPANILLDMWGAPRLTDFDLVSGPDTTGGTRTGAMGTVGYVAPEAMRRPQDADASADVYSLGMTAIFCLFGNELPTETIRDPAFVVKYIECDDEIKNVLIKSVEWDKGSRFQNANEFCAELKRALNSINSSRTASGKSVRAFLRTEPFILTRPVSRSSANDSHTGLIDSDTSAWDARSVATSDSDDPYIGTIFDKRYRIEQLLGEGGMGVVYLARHTIIDKKVAVKILRADLASDRENLRRFLREAKAASKIGNPHIVDISDFGDLPDGATYFVMEYLDGLTLSSIIDKEKRLPFERICDIGIQIAAGLAAAHARGIIHRDLKPDNIIVISKDGREFVKILDFGIAKVVNSEESKLTRLGTVFGTPHYMSPEQANGSTLDHRTDIYSLGILLYEMTTGQLPFDAESPIAVASKHITEKPVPVRELVPQCSPALESLILKCLVKDPDARYQTMSELAGDFDRVRVIVEMDEVSGLIESTEVISGTGSPKLNIHLAIAVLAFMLIIIVSAIVFKLMSRPQPLWTATGNQPFPPILVSSVSESPSTPPLEPPVIGSSRPDQECREKNLICVELSANPSRAKAMSAEGKLLELPAIIKVKRGKVVTIKILAKGYAPASVHLNGMKQRVRVDLILLDNQEYVPPPPSATAPQPTALPLPSSPPSTADPQFEPEN